MKKIIILIVFFVIFVFGVSAQEEKQNSIKRFSVGWNVGLINQPLVSSRLSNIGFGFIIFNNDAIVIKNQISIVTGVLNMEDTGIKNHRISVFEKVTVGSMTNNKLFHYYGLLEGGIGLCGLEEYDYFKNQLLGNVGLGIGLDIFPIDKLSFFTEIKFVGNIYEEKFFPQQGFELGVRFHF